jgi:hypothetical protein
MENEREPGAIRLLRMRAWLRLSRWLAVASAWAMRQRAKACGCDVCLGIVMGRDAEPIMRVAVMLRTQAMAEAAAMRDPFEDVTPPADRRPS